ncbi:polynucleotidyl transferase [Striga asiatica]|uniref:Polynucleotidyl transferase n=1 Tax=Striga asiatica TaxID=4170 RepID=A0A5A7Q159_STRAF|nr:polynucleotidyl transferase [Striga asiatica]
MQMKYMKPMKLYHELLKSNELKRSSLLGLDVGDKYVGLSVSDANNKIASPLSVLVRNKNNIDLIASDFKSLISKLSLSGLVVGYPFDRQRSSPDAVQVKIFIDGLTKTGKFGNLKYTFWDECFTSKNVEFLLKPLSLHPVQFKTILDKFAAVGILQGYLDFVNRSLDQEAEIFQNENYAESVNDDWCNSEN